MAASLWRLRLIINPQTCCGPPASSSMSMMSMSRVIASTTTSRRSLSTSIRRVPHHQYNTGHSSAALLSTTAAAVGEAVWPHRTLTPSLPAVSTHLIPAFNMAMRHMATTPPPPVSSSAAATSTATTPSVDSSVSVAAAPSATSKLNDKAAKPKLPAGSVSRLIGLAKPEFGLMAVGTTCLFAAAGVTMYVPTGFGKLIDMVTTNQDPALLGSYAAGLGALFVAGAFVNFGRVVSFTLAGHRLIRRLREKLFGHIIGQDIKFFDQNRTGELINRLSTDTEVMAKSLTGVNFSQGLRSTVQGIFGLGYMFHLSPELTGIVAGVVPVVLGFAWMYGRFIRKLSTQVQDALSRATDVANEKLGNIRTVRAFAQEDFESARYNKAVDNVFQLAKKEAVANGLFFASAGLGGSACVLGVLYAGGQMVMSGQGLTAGVLSSFLMYTFYVGVSVGSVSGAYADAMKGLGASTRIFQILDSSATIPNRGGIIPTNVVGNLRFENVSFTYPTRDNVQIFNDLELNVRAGSSLAVVGASGSGKSTLASLLLRYYDPQQGRLYLDDYDVSTIDPTWLRKNIGIVSQEPVLFNASIRENLRYANENASEEDLERCAREANAHNFISSFPDGYNTQVGEKGLSLSGGQKQRIAIARALLTNPRILILDEATSALDAESEHLVQEALERLMIGRTVIVIAHRLSTIKKAESIAVIDKGRIAEQGNHDELMDRDGIYRQLMTLQMSGFAPTTPTASIVEPNTSP